jgi:hypothetical protein
VITGLAGLLDSLPGITVSERTEAADSDGVVSGQDGEGFVRPGIGPHVDRSRGAIPGLAGSRRSPGECGPEQSAAFGGGEPVARAGRSVSLSSEGRDTAPNRGVQPRGQVTAAGGG